LKLSDFDYELPPERIAQAPCAQRDQARLLVHEIGADRTRHLGIRDLPELLLPGDLLVLNDTRVLAARLFGRRRSGGRVEFLFLEPHEHAGARGKAWTAFCNPARKLHPGEELLLEGGPQRARMVERPRTPQGEPAKEWVVELLEEDGSAADAHALFQAHGHVPLPPYIQRAAEQGGEQERTDRERYQTVYARHPGAVAAPTAGLHFTDELLSELEERGIAHAFLTLHVGPGTFEPVKVEEVERHRMHAERFELPARTVREVARARERGGRVVAVGTTCVRALESAYVGDGLREGPASTELFLRPGSPFQVVDVLLTNFHLPKSTLLMLVSAFAGRERVLRLYAEAIAQGYRFYSYGDAMLFLP
jgi:S-adenosylmethionine:tRNA ribosyltransferase-isomerase